MSDPPASPLRRSLWLLGGILLLAGLVYSSSLRNGFIYFDDPESVVNNPYIRQLSWANLVHYFTTPVQFMYMPLASISWAIDYQLGALDPFVYHLDNLILHLGNVVLVFTVFYLLTRRPRIALLVCLLFAVHPVNADTVSSVATRTNLLATFFYLAALLCYSLYVERRQALGWLALSCLAFLLAACAKSSVVVLPLTLFLWDYWYERPWDRRLLIDKIPFLAVAVLFGVLALTLRVDVPPPVHYGPIDRVLVFAYAVAGYCVRLFLPLRLSLNYDYPVLHGPWLPLPYYLAPLLLALAGLWLRQLALFRKVVIFGVAFFLLNIALSQSVLLIDNFMANRYAYLPYLGLFLVLAELGDAIWSAAADRQGGWRVRLACGALLVIAVGGFAALAHARTSAWRDSLALFDDVIQKQPGSAWVWGTRGLVKMHMKDLEGAKQDLDRSLQLDPTYNPGLCYRGVVHYLSRDYPAALADLDKALAAAPRLSGAYRDRGKVKLAMQDAPGALADFDRAIALDPRSEARFWRGVMKSDRGDYRGALADLEVAIANAPDDRDALYMRGMVEVALGDRTAGCADLSRARQLGFQPPPGQPLPDCP